MTAWLKNYWPCILILLAIIGFVSKSLYNYPIGIMALLGLYKIILMSWLLLALYFTSAKIALNKD